MVKQQKTSKAKKTRPFIEKFNHYKIFVFVVIFAGIGGYLLFRANASNLQNVDPDKIAAGYIESKPVVISKNLATGEITYPSYPKSYFLFKDGTLLCDDGNTLGVQKTVKLSTKDNDNARKELAGFGISQLTQEALQPIGTAISTYEGFLAESPKGLSALMLTDSSKKTNNLKKSQDKILNLCEKATRQQKRHDAKKIDLTLNDESTGSLGSRLTALIMPKAEAAQQYPITENRYAADQQFKFINDHRASKGLRKLTRLSCYDSLAFTWSKIMAETAYLHHNPDLGSWMGSAYFCPSYYNWTTLGENVGVTNSTQEGLFKAFLDSPAHRANIEDPRWNYAGVGAYNNNTLGKVYVTQNFMQY